MYTMYTHMSMCVHICMYMCIYIYIYTIYIYIYMMGGPMDRPEVHGEPDDHREEEVRRLLSCADS